VRPATIRLGLCLALLGAPGTTTAQPGEASVNELAPTMAELLALRAELASEQDALRQHALTGLMELGDETLPVIRARLRALGASERPGRPMQVALAELRRASAHAPQGDPHDLASGLAETLTLDRSEPTVLVCELIALLRALEAQHSLAAAEVIVSELFALEPRLLRQEATRTRRRLGKLLVPAYLRHRYDARPGLRQLAREGLGALGMNSEERLFGQQDGEQLAATVHALGDAYAKRDTHDARERAAVPWTVALLDDVRPGVRAAARRTVLLMGENAAEPLAQRALDLGGTLPDEGSDAGQLLGKVIEQVEARRLQLVSGALQRARSAINRAELTLAEEQLALALTHEPSPALANQLALAYQELGRRLDDTNQPLRALSASRRALRLDPNLKPARARVLYLEAEQRVADGVPDLHALRTASALDPTHPSARPLLDELRGDRVQSAYTLRRQLGFVAAGLVALAACLVLHLRRASLRAMRLSQRRTEGSLH
jgi:tetratricopeptide (TPR) repeat protein